MYHHGRHIYTKRVILEKVIVPTTKKYVIPLGDSLTNHCIWEAEIMNICNSIEFVGTRFRTVQNSDGENVTVYDEGRSGFSSFDYTNGHSYTGGSDGGGDETVNRWYNEGFSMTHYMNNYYPQSKPNPDAITFFLGMNDIIGTSKTVDEIVENIKTMLDSIREYNSTLPVLVLTPNLRYFNSNSAEENYKMGQYSMAVENLVKSYQHMAFVPLSIGMDSEHNYNMKDVTINTRTTETQKVASDITHPNNNGYWQMADWIVGGISKLLS